MKKTESPGIKARRPMQAVKWVVIGLILAGTLIGLQTYRQSKMQAERRAIMEEQRQVLVDGWKAQGMTDEEIQQKLESQRPAGAMGDRQPRSGFSIMRLFGGGRPSGGGRI